MLGLTVTFPEVVLITVVSIGIGAEVGGREVDVLNPLPVQDVALVDDQVKVELPPGEIEVGLAESVAVGRRLKVSPLTKTVALAL